MPTYAILGATGKTGGALVTLLLKNPQNTIHAYVRSKPKLLSQFHHLDSNPSVQVFQGALDNIPLLASCISSVDAIFSCIGENENTPGLRIVLDSAHSTVAALCHLGCPSANGAAKVPRVIFLSSASLNPRMTSDQPAIFHWLLMNAMANAYADVGRAEEYLRLHQSWLKVTFIQPGALVEDEQKGHALSLDRKGAVPFVSYLDLAAGMIDVAESGEFDAMGVSVVSTSQNVKFEWRAPIQLLKGLVWTFVPPLAHGAKCIGLF